MDLINNCDGSGYNEAMIHAQKISNQLNINIAQINSTLELLEIGNTLPFIARYRKEVTGGLDEEQLRLIIEMLARLKALDERRATVLNTISEQGKLTPELNQKILSVDTLTALEDLYLPYKPKRRTRASTAREQGLHGLADQLIRQERTRL
jgi:uncharacterized protein